MSDTDHEVERAYHDRLVVAEILSEPSEHEKIATTLRMHRNAIITASDGSVPDRICWMPRGFHQVECRNRQGELWSGIVICDEETARAVQASFDEYRQLGWRWYLDYDHRNSAVAGWVRGFSWEPSVGVMCSVDWSRVAKSVIRARSFVTFSPEFVVDSHSGRVAGLECGQPAGGLVNAAAFGAAMPPLLSLHGRDAAAELMSQQILADGHPQHVADAIARAVRAGADGKVISTVLQTLWRG